MDYKKVNAPITTVTRDMIAMAEQTGNVYETVCIIGKRANQISAEMKKELDKKLKEFEYKTIQACYYAYKALKGNSFIDHIYKEMEEWEII